ncbi:MAG TPA: flavin reductase family protein [Candidatus Sulfotelmatobacter sp.]|jgi:flavin reductase (DIM6/NTAB) family NADH-FMN oxidoreductase RutF|nr:flavin reductase family protein [Candidatus Sulfotelmatobacter sp.]
MSIDDRMFRKALGCFATGITVVTSKAADGAPVGLTVNAFSSLSLDPPQVLVCLDKRTGCLDAFRQSGAFAVHVLRQDQRELSITFASKQADKFAGLSPESRVSGAPVLPGCLALFDCRTEQVIEGGDHLIFIGRVVHLEHSEAGQPLLYYRGSYNQLGDTSLP